MEKYLHGKFVEWGIRFIAVVDHVDTDDRANKKSRQINGLVNEWYLEDLSNNVRSVLDHKRREGQYIASFALYGYRKDPD
ncbi:recombinase, partial [Escherichia coli]